MFIKNMKILLIGEFSSLYNNLKKGLTNLGYEVDTANSGDGYKNLKRNIDLGSKYSGILGRIIKIYKNVKLLLSIKKYEVVQIINPNSSFSKVLYSFKYFGLKGYYLSAAGDDVQFIRNGLKNNYRYWPYKDIELPSKEYYQSKVDLKRNEFIISNSKRVIPIMYEYAEAYRNSKYKSKLSKTIQIPMDIANIEYKKNIVGSKIIIFHGLNREGFKGTKFIKEAMEIIKEKYPKKVEIIIDGKMPLKEYKKVISKANIVVDQCKGYSNGVNALLAMSQGKVVLGGNEIESQNEFKRYDIPTINIKPEVSDIVNKLEKLINNPESITEIGKESRKFVEDFHECTKVAKEYLEVWGEKS